jgi:hypothetical protein
MRKSVILGGFVLAAAGMSAPGYGSYLQDFESMTVNTTVNGQEGWTATASANATIVDDGGNQFLRIVDDSGNTAPSVAYAQVFTLTAGTNDQVSFDIRQDGNSGGDLHFNLAGNNGGVWVAKSAFRKTGAIAPDNGADVVPTFANNEWYQVIYDLNPTNNTYRFRMIKKSDSSVLVDTTNPFITNSISNIYYFQFVMDDPDNVDGIPWRIDNFSVQNTPEPAGMGLILMGAVLAMRRRKRR